MENKMNSLYMDSQCSLVGPGTTLMSFNRHYCYCCCCQMWLSRAIRGFSVMSFVTFSPFISVSVSLPASCSIFHSSLLSAKGTHSVEATRLLVASSSSRLHLYTCTSEMMIWYANYIRFQFYKIELYCRYNKMLISRMQRRCKLRFNII